MGSRCPRLYLIGVQRCERHARESCETHQA
jgi:hypothetical protein